MGLVDPFPRLPAPCHHPHHHTMIVLLLVIAALIVGVLWCRLYQRSICVRGMFSVFKSAKSRAHLRKDSRRSTHSVHGSSRRSEITHGGKCCLSPSTSDKPVPAPGAIVHSASDWEIEGGHFTITQGKYNSLTIHINRKSFCTRARTHLIDFYDLETPTA